MKPKKVFHNRQKIVMLPLRVGIVDIADSQNIQQAYVLKQIITINYLNNK